MDKLTCYVYFNKKFFALNKIDLPRQICFKIIKLKVNKLTLRFKKIFIPIKNYPLRQIC